MQPIPADVQCFQLSVAALDQLDQLFTVRMVQVGVDQTETLDVIFGRIEQNEKLVGDRW